MMTYDEVRSQSRCDIALMNVYSFMAMRPSYFIWKVENEPMEKVFCVRVFYQNSRTGNKQIHSYNFYRSTEAEEADRFINTICDEFHTTLTGDPVF